MSKKTLKKYHTPVFAVNDVMGCNKCQVTIYAHNKDEAKTLLRKQLKKDLKIKRLPKGAGVLTRYGKFTYPNEKKGTNPVYY